MSKDLYLMPEPKAVVRDGDALLEFHQGESVVGSLNFSKILRSWFSAASDKKTSLQVVP
jgi:hypothetical protein